MREATTRFWYVPFAQLGSEIDSFRALTLFVEMVNVTGRAIVGGTLEIRVASDYDPPVGQIMTIVTAGRAVEGTFAEVIGATLPGGKRMDVDYAPNAVRLRVVAN
jgi:hypothetical protein